jgi:hypothetical protein
MTKSKQIEPKGAHMADLQAFAPNLHYYGPMTAHKPHGAKLASNHRPPDEM